MAAVRVDARKEREEQDGACEAWAVGAHLIPRALAILGGHHLELALALGEEVR
jgi:hypothetical protein